MAEDTTVTVPVVDLQRLKAQAESARSVAQAKAVLDQLRRHQTDQQSLQARLRQQLQQLQADQQARQKRLSALTADKDRYERQLTQYLRG